MVNESSVFSFELNESLYFEKGQEVAEIMGISLEPEISIQEFSDYISIRGVVELQGSYQKNQDLSFDEDESYLEGYDSKRYMERVTDTQFGGAEFMHRFPVEITVPSYRVENLDDVTVVISEFDYELPASDHLFLRSTIEIHGINSQVEELEVEESDGVENVEPSLTSRNAHDSFEFEVKQEDESSSYIEDSPEQLPTLEAQADDPESDRWKFMQKTQTFDEFFQKNKEPEVVEVIVDDVVVEESSSFLGDESRSSEASYESRVEKADLTYLADIFRSDEEEYTKLRLCIVQSKDTLEALAEKYETSTLHIRNQNSLEDDDLTEGQLLYIPVKN